MEEYLPSQNRIVQQIEQGLQLSRNLQLATLLVGEPATGKHTLVRWAFPSITIADGRDEAQVRQMLEQETELCIEHFEALSEPESLHFTGKRILAIADSSRDLRRWEPLFAFVYRMPPLRERPEDLPGLIRHFLRKGREELSLRTEELPEIEHPDLTENFRSLRSSIYRRLLLADLDASELEEAFYRFFLRELKGENAYRENLGILERPLLRAGLERYGSQLRLAAVLGINRNTLRKKLHEYDLD
ncbi:helix-turn-helix domain-containing protein [Nitratifractor sp.]